MTHESVNIYLISHVLFLKYHQLNGFNNEITYTEINVTADLK